MVLPLRLQARQQVGYELHSSCVNVGFFYIKNAGVPEDLRQRALHLAEQFFALPEVGLRDDGKFAIRDLRDGRGRWSTTSWRHATINDNSVPLVVALSGVEAEHLDQQCEPTHGPGGPGTRRPPATQLQGVSEGRWRDTVDSS